MLFKVTKIVHSLFAYDNKIYDTGKNNFNKKFFQGETEAYLLFTF